MGGLARRVGYEKALKEATGGTVPVAQVDVGHAFSDLADPKGFFADDTRLKNEWVLKGFAAAGVAAVNVSERDLPFVGPLMAASGHDERLKTFPALDTLVSANVVPANNSVKPFKPYIVREFSGSRIGKKPIRVGFLGLSEPGRTEVEALQKREIGGFTVTDPVAAAKKYVPELRKTCDLVVVLGYVDQDLAKKIGTAAPGIDLVLAARELNLINTVDEAGDAVIGYVANQTKWLGEFRFYHDEKTGKVSNYLHRNVPLDDAIPNDPAAKALVDDARESFTSVQRRMSGPTDASAATIRERARLERASRFSGAESCEPCHKEEFAIWQKSGHAHAFQTLEAKSRHLDASCTACHTVGQGVIGGFQTASLTPRLENVQCESCHTAGRTHARQPTADGYGAVVTPDGCVLCHTKENSPDFEFASYWAKIKHGKGATEAAKVGT